MTTLATLDAMVRGGAAALFVLWIVLLLRDERGAPAARVAIAMNLSILAYIVAPLLADGSARGTAFLVCDSLSVLAPALFWVFARFYFDDRVRLGSGSLAVLATFALAPVVQAGLMLWTGHYSFAIWFAVRIAMISFTAGALWIAWRGRTEDLVETRRSLRLLLVGVTGALTLWVSAFEAIGFRAARPDLGHLATMAAILVATLSISAAMYRFRGTAVFAGAARRAGQNVAVPASPAAARSPLAARLLTIMAEEKPYRAEGFSIGALAARLGEPEYRVRRAINGELGHRNFTAFLNGYRLDEVRAALADPAQRDVPILTIAIDAGFGSLGPFNRAFREAEGTTPSAWRADRAGG